MTLKSYIAEVRLGDEVEEVPLWAESLEEADTWASEEYGEDACVRIRPRVNHDNVGGEPNDLEESTRKLP